MSSITGGLRARLIKDSTYEMLRTALGNLGWFTVVPSRKNITFPREPVAIDTQVPLNTICLTDDQIDTEDIEIGSNLGEYTWQFYLDFYAENDTLGLHLIRDVKDVLEGRMLSIGRSFPVIEVYDFRMATPARIFNVEVDDVNTDKAHNQTQGWLRHWYSCRFSIIDSYRNDQD